MDNVERQKFWDTLCSLTGEDIEADARTVKDTIIYPRFLYRFRSVSVSSIEALQTNKLYFSKANYYDDPFDTLIKINYDALHRYTKDLLASPSLYDRLSTLSEATGIAEQVWKDSIDQLKQLDVDVILSRIDAFLKANIQSYLKENMWSICFSEGATNEAMWLKYADQYKGFCVIYDLNDENNKLCGKQEKCKNCVVNSAGVSLYPVYYSDEGYDATDFAKNLMTAVLASNMFSPEIANKVIASLPNALWQQERITLVKSKCHEYDEEGRMLLRNNARGQVMQEWIPYGIAFGLRTSERDRLIITRSAQVAGIQHFFETFINDENRLDIREITLNAKE